MNSVLITGCAGFIGSHVCEVLLEKGWKVIGIDNFDLFYERKIKESNLAKCMTNPNFILQELDITDTISINKIDQQIDIVIHFAAKAGVLPSLKTPLAYIHTNIYGSATILEFMKIRGIKKYIFASSSSIYGNSKNIPFKENISVDHPVSPYAFTKKSAELMNYTYHHLYNIDILNLRFFTVYGPRQRPDLAIHKFIKQIYNKEPITIYGDGTTARDYTHITDIVHGIDNAINYLLSENNVCEIINLGNNHPVMLSELINIISKLIDQKINIKYLPLQAGDVDITYADISKAQKLLSYHPTTEISYGIKDFISWYNSKK